MRKSCSTSQPVGSPAFVRGRENRHHDVRAGGRRGGDIAASFVDLIRKAGLAARRRGRLKVQMCDSDLVGDLIATTLVSPTSTPPSQTA